MRTYQEIMIITEIQASTEPKYKLYMGGRQTGKTHAIMLDLQQFPDMCCVVKNQEQKDKLLKLYPIVNEKQLIVPEMRLLNE